MRNILLLSSTRFLYCKPPLLFKKAFKDLNMAYVITASKGVTDVGYLERNRDYFKRNNFLFEEIDLDGKTEKELRKKLSTFEIIFVEGGNSFYLLKSIRSSGFVKS